MVNPFVIPHSFVTRVSNQIGFDTYYYFGTVSVKGIVFGLVTDLRLEILYVEQTGQIKDYSRKQISSCSPAREDSSMMPSERIEKIGCNYQISYGKAECITYSTYESCTTHIIKDCGLRFETQHANKISGHCRTSLDYLVRQIITASRRAPHPLPKYGCSRGN